MALTTTRALTSPSSELGMYGMRVRYPPCSHIAYGDRVSIDTSDSGKISCLNVPGGRCAYIPGGRRHGDGGVGGGGGGGDGGTSSI